MTGLPDLAASTGVSPEPLRLAVLNPGGSDADQAFPDYAGSPQVEGHAPINYHAYAACTAGGFHRHVATVLRQPFANSDAPLALVLLRRDLKLCLKSLLALQAKGWRVAVSLKESGGHQVAALLLDSARTLLFRQICEKADFCLSSTPELVPFYLGAGAKRAEFIPTPYPVDDPRWDFSRPATERRGVFVGTREFEVPSRNHLAALWAARQLGEPVSVVNLDGRRGRKRLAALGFPADGLKIVEGRMDYPRYLQLMAGHRIVFQLDRSAVPGQVAGDALLCGVPCVGGDGAVERIAFPDFCGRSREPSALLECAARLFREDDFYLAAVAQSQLLAHERLSFGAVRRQLERLR